MFRSGNRFILALMFILVGAMPLAAYYYLPDNNPPGPPPNYNPIDPSYFNGAPVLDSLTPTEMDGYYIYFDSLQSLWTINRAIPSGISAYEQFHGSILVQMEEEPEAGFNVWPMGFDLTGDLHRNDRWGWVKWPDSIAPNLYEIWWNT